jgi:metallothionein
MSTYTEGTVLTCGHGGCGCRVRIETECNCEGAGGSYVCVCGEPMVVLDTEAKAEQATW